MSSRLPASTRPWSEVGVGGGGLAVAQGEGGVAFPLVAEPAHVVQGGGVRPRSVGEELERAAGLDGDSWAQSPTSSTFAPAAVACGGDLVEVSGGGHGRLVDDDQLPGLQCPAAGTRLSSRRCVAAELRVPT